MNVSNKRVTVICAAPSSLICAELLNPNPWSSSSKPVINSIGAEFSVLHYCVLKIVDMCRNSEQLCSSQIKDLLQQWELARFDLDKVHLFGEQPELHLGIKAFFSNVKSVLDLAVQLLSTEGIVNSQIHGFHRKGVVHGGKVINALRKNTSKGNEKLAQKIEKLIKEHKQLWIDEVIKSRDLLVHPEIGLRQLMFHFDGIEENETLIISKINPPLVGATPIDNFAQITFEHTRAFLECFIKLIWNKRI